MAGIFISYRRHDSSGHAGRLFDHLRARLGGVQIFMDVAGIAAGADFVTAIQTSVAACDALVAVIGREWLNSTDAAGARRIEQPSDFVRIEIATALKRAIPVFVALVDGASLPPPKVLPEALAELARAQSFTLDTAHWHEAVSRLVAALTTALEAAPGKPNRHRRRLLLVGAVGALVLGPAAVLLSSSKGWSWRSGREEPVHSVRSDLVLDPAGTSIKALALLADGRLVIGAAGQIVFWNPTTSKLAGRIATGSDDVLALAVLPGGLLATGGRTGSIAIWNLEFGVVDATLTGHTEAVTALVRLEDGRLASGSRDRTVKLWNLGSRRLEATLEGHTNQVRALAVLPSGLLASGSLDRTVRIWNLEARPLRVKVLDGQGHAINALAPLAGGNLAAGAEGGVIEVWNVETTLAAAPLMSGQSWINALLHLPPGRLVAGQDDGRITVWNLAAGTAEASLEEHTKPVTALALLPDGRLASASADGTIRIWRIDSA